MVFLLSDLFRHKHTHIHYKTHQLFTPHMLTQQRYDKVPMNVSTFVGSSALPNNPVTGPEKTAEAAGPTDARHKSTNGRDYKGDLLVVCIAFGVILFVVGLILILVYAVRANDESHNGADHTDTDAILTSSYVFFGSAGIAAIGAMLTKCMQK